MLNNLIWLVSAQQFLHNGNCPTRHEAGRNEKSKIEVYNFFLFIGLPAAVFSTPIT